MNTVIVDDSDPKVTYTGAWVFGGNPNGELDGTTHWTITAGATAKLIFSGTSIAVFGTISTLSVSPANPVSTYSIDGSKIDTFSPTEDDSIHYRQQFFQSPPLASGSHTLVITSNVDNGYFFLDYFQFTPDLITTSSPTLTKTTTISASRGPTPNANQSTTSVTLTTSSQTFTTITQGSLGTPTIITQGSDTLVSSTPSQPSNSSPSQSSNSSPSHSSIFSVSASSAASSTRSGKAPVGAIIGGAIAAAALVVIAAIALCLIRRSRRTRQGQRDSGPRMTPFQNTSQSGSSSDYAIREGPNVGLRNTPHSNTRDRKALTNPHNQGPVPIPPGLQSTLQVTTGTPRHLQDQEVASSTNADSPPEYDYGGSTRR